jgi:hypothetical protein
MKIRITLFISLCILSAVSFAQTISPEPNDTLWIDDVPMNVLTMHDIYQFNNSDDTIGLTWETVLVDVPAGWDYSICDNGTCYVGIPDGFTMPNPVPPGDSGFLGLNLTPTSEGSGIVQVYVHVEGEPADGFLCTWIFSAETVGVAQGEQQAQFVLYPNPVHDVLRVANGQRENVQYQIRNAVGELVDVQTSNASVEMINVSGLMAGVYFVQVITESRRQSLRFVKR